ncbi:hypothetical protein DPEC_G00180190 [Dallia pectoralis]|uniref:Uncharacterized protein n=1 Tax=Dallia pectoralis TaxID=75939 RepID=A0ACC2G9Y0_DALPE|nr:hypothetical protein DPEC_G00180190 [Dallia pectoralis]
MNRPLFMKTYGKKHTRKFHCWVSPDNRKIAFASTSSSDISITRPTSPKAPVLRMRKGTSVAGRGVRVAKTKALACLIDDDSDEDSDEENVFLRPLLQSPQQQSSNVITARKPRFKSVVRKRVVSTSESDFETSLRKQNIKRPRHTKTKTIIPPSPGGAPGCFVTHRRGATKHKAPKRRNKVQLARPCLNSSDEFSQVQRALPRRPTRVRPHGVASSDSSLADLGNISAGSGFLHEVSLNRLSERSLGPCHRKPLFSSTPSSRSLSRPLCLRPSISPSVDDLYILSSTQEEMDVLGEPLPAPVTGPGPQSPGHPEEGNCEEKPSCGSPSLGSSRNAGSKIQHGVTVASCEQTDPDRNGEETEGGSHFVSATVGPDEVKERCLALRCVVEMERVDKLHQETRYSSCIDLTPDTVDHTQSHNHRGSVDHTQSHNHRGSVDHTQSHNHRGSVDHTQSHNHRGSVDHTQSHNHRGSVDHTQSHNHRGSVDHTQSHNHKGSVDHTQSHNHRGSVDHTHSHDHRGSLNNGPSIVLPVNGCQNQTQSHYSRNSSVQLISVTNTRLSDGPQDLSSKQALSLEAKLKQSCLVVHCQVQLNRMTTTLSPTEIARSDSGPCGKTHSSNNHNTRSDSGHSDDRTRSERVARKNDVPKKQKASVVLKERRLSKDVRCGDRQRTSRKACVSGMSVGRWGRRDEAFKTAPPPGRAGDCSITELLSAQHTNKVLGDNMVLGTPVRHSRLPLSSLLFNFSPDTHTWSRLKAALSIHKKTKASMTPKWSQYLLSPSSMKIKAELADVSQDLFATPLRTPLPQYLHSQLMRSMPVSVCEFDRDISDADKVYSECGQTGPLGFMDCIPPDRLKDIKKIGEGTFGEVFSTTNTAGEAVALKIIPVEGCEPVNGEEQKTFGEILHEIIISKELSSLKEKTHNQTTGFIGLKNLHCVQGKYPPDLLKSWDCFNTLRGSENDRPDFFSEEQLFLILEFEFGGSDLENSNGQLSSVVVAKSVLHQVAAALAVAEQELHFEHRDLHWGNVLVQTTKDKLGSFLLNGTSHSIETRGVTVRIIDYSLSRLEIDGLTVSCDISEDEELFQGQGDYQFDIYRIMRQENRCVCVLQ